MIVLEAGGEYKAWPRGQLLNCLLQYTCLVLVGIVILGARKRVDLNREAKTALQRIRGLELQYTGSARTMF